MSISNFVFHVLLFFNDAKKIMTNNNENEHASELFNRIFSFHHKQQAEMKGWETDNNYAAEQRIISCMIFGSAQTWVI